MGRARAVARQTTVTALWIDPKQQQIFPCVTHLNPYRIPCPGSGGYPDNPQLPNGRDILQECYTSPGNRQILRYSFRIADGPMLYGRWAASGYDIKSDEFRDVSTTIEELERLITWSGLTFAGRVVGAQQGFRMRAPSVKIRWNLKCL